MITPIKITNHAELLANNPRYKELIAAVEAQAKALDAAYDKLLIEFPLEEEWAIYCVFGDGSCRPTHTTPHDI